MGATVYLLRYAQSIYRVGVRPSTSLTDQYKNGFRPHLFKIYQEITKPYTFRNVNYFRGQSSIWFEKLQHYPHRYPSMGFNRCTYSVHRILCNNPTKAIEFLQARGFPGFMNFAKCHRMPCDCKKLLVILSRHYSCMLCPIRV